MRDDLPMDSASLLASLSRLQRAGIIDQVIHDDRTAAGTFSWTPSYLKLLMAERQVFSEPGLLAAWATGDPLAVRAWIEREAALLPDPALSQPKKRKQRTRRKP
jgi:hypothetical protein